MVLVKNKMAWPCPTLSKKTFLIYFYLLLFLSCIILVRRYNLTEIKVPTTTNRSNSTDLNTSNKNVLNNTTKPTKQTSKVSKTGEFPLICPLTNQKQTCPSNNYPTTIENDVVQYETCPNYFRWVHEDIRPWKTKGITKEMVEAGKSVANFRLIILEGKVYVETYKKAFQTRDVFTIWGILQLVRLYPGKLPDLDLMFACDDNPVIKKSDYHHGNDTYDDDNTSIPVPVFRYYGDDEHYDIPFPDWSFWGWHELNIKPWEMQLEEIKEGNQKMKWAKRVPHAHWKGNLNKGSRKNLLKCNSSRAKSEIYEQGLQEVGGDLADQCTHRYKIYMEGKTWSASEKYIQACDSMLLLVQPRYYDFFSRSLLPLKHYWPIKPSSLCESIKFAVNWGNKNPFQAQEIAKDGFNFIMEELKMKYVYDYMYHLLNEYGKLMKYKPTIPQGAVEVCSETMACNAFGKEKEWKMNSLVKAPSQTGPCKIPPPYDPHHLHKFLSTKDEVLTDVVSLARVG